MAESRRKLVIKVFADTSGGAFITVWLFIAVVCCMTSLRAIDAAVQTRLKWGVFQAWCRWASLPGF
jgi:hypothetical protein